jgi:hypothetical protein
MSTKGGIYFPFRANFTHDQTARRIRRKFGHEGFDAYCCLLDMILQADGRLPYKTEDDALDVDSQLEDVDPTAFLAELESIGAIQLVDGALMSPLVSEGVTKYQKASERGKKAINARWKKSEPNGNDFKLVEGQN